MSILELRNELFNAAYEADSNRFDDAFNELQNVLRRKPVYSQPDRVEYDRLGDILIRLKNLELAFSQYSVNADKDSAGQWAKIEELYNSIFAMQSNQNIK